MSTDMPSTAALTIRQPWAFAIAEGHKTVEVRTRRTSYRGPLLIHAGLKVQRDVAIVRYSRAAAQRLDELGGSGNYWEPAFRLPSRLFPAPPTSLALGAFIAVADLEGVHELNGCCQPWSNVGTGLWHWELSNVRMLTKAIPCRGSLGIWKPNPALAEEALALAAAADEREG